MASRRRWYVLSCHYFLALLRLITWRKDDMPEHIESMFDDCEYSSDPSSVLRRASKNEAGWLARFARKRAEEEREALELGLERELQVIKYQRLLCSLVAHAEVVAVRVSAARSAQLPRPADARCRRDAKTGASGGRTHGVGRAHAIVRRGTRGTVQGRPAFPGSGLVVLRSGACPFYSYRFLRLRICFRHRRTRGWIAAWMARMYILAPARPRDGSNSQGARISSLAVLVSL
jgi:hypothetical protein